MQSGTHADARSVALTPINMRWLDKHYSDFLRGHPPTESERLSEDADGFLDRLMGKGDL